MDDAEPTVTVSGNSDGGWIVDVHDGVNHGVYSPEAADAGFGVGYVAEARGLGRFGGIGDDFRELLWRFTTAPGSHALVGCGSRVA